MQKLLAKIDQLGICRTHQEEAVVEYIDEVQRGYSGLARPECQVEGLVDLKFKMQHWRQRVFDSLSERDELWVFRILSRLQFRPNDQVLLVLKEKVEKKADKKFRAAADGYFNVLGAHEFVSEGQTSALAGPPRKLPILANAPSSCTFSKWVSDAAFSTYQFEGEGVRYRALDLLPGDVFVTHVNRDGNGVYTAMIEPRAFGYHIGVFAIFNQDGRRIPVVLETYKLGVRAVPLSSFTDPKFTSYIEVCRLNEKPEGFSKRFNAFAQELPDKVKGYNFDTEDKDREYISCTTIASHLFEQAGAGGIQANSRYIQEPLIQRNLAQYDFVLPAFLSPTDFIVEKKMRMTGVIDNGHFHRNLARELCEREFVRTFRSGNLDISKLPLMFALNRFGVRQMRAGTWLGKLIGKPYGFNTQNFPKGPEKVLAVIELYEHMLEAAVKEASDRIQSLWNPAETVDLPSLEADPKIKGVLKYALRPIALAFVK